MKTKTKWHLDPIGARYRIWNSITGAYIHRHIMRPPMTFASRSDAVLFIMQHDLNREIYYTEAAR